jgi:predicted nucleotidyltransferase
MAVSINGKLGQLANEYYISYGSIEQKKIDASVETLKSRLKTHFSGNVLSVVEFGSYKRDTILPRQYDEHSDVDLMIVFNHSNLRYTPGTYRNHLIDFADKRYSRSDVKKSSPTVVLELDHIKYDLIPAYEETSILSTNKTIYIPQNDTYWMITDPHGFNAELTRVNTANNSNIKKVIRLLKAWNAKTGYPVASFQLEQEIARIVYWMWGDTTLENYFFKAIDGMSSSTNDNLFYPNPKIVSLKDNANRIKACLQADNLVGANGWLAHILPL